MVSTMKIILFVDDERSDFQSVAVVVLEGLQSDLLPSAQRMIVFIPTKVFYLFTIILCTLGSLQVHRIEIVVLLYIVMHSFSDRY